MSLVNEALRKAAQQAAMQRQRESGESPGLAMAPEPAHAPMPTPSRGGSPVALAAIGGSTLVIAALLVGVIVAIKSMGGPQPASAGHAPEPVTAPTPVEPTEPSEPSEPSKPVEPVKPDTDEPVRPVLEFRPPTTPDPEPTTPEPTEPAAPVEPVEPEPVSPEPVEPVEPAEPEPVEPEPAKLRVVPDGEYLGELDVSDCPPLKLGAIIFSERLQAALINGRMVEAGSNVDGVKVEAIEPKKVTMRSPLGTRFYLILP